MSVVVRTPSKVSKKSYGNIPYGAITGVYKLRKTVQTGTTYSVAINIDLVVCNRATTGIAILLPAATGTGRPIVIKNINTGIATVTGSGAETIDGDVTQPLDQWDSITAVDYVTGKWVII
jgi:hypothetical protein